MSNTYWAQQLENLMVWLSERLGKDSHKDRLYMIQALQEAYKLGDEQGWQEEMDTQLTSCSNESEFDIDRWRQDNGYNTGPD